jgi:hypothetical protein
LGPTLAPRPQRGASGPVRTPPTTTHTPNARQGNRQRAWHQRKPAEHCGQATTFALHYARHRLPSVRARRRKSWPTMLSQDCEREVCDALGAQGESAALSRPARPPEAAERPGPTLTRDEAAGFAPPPPMASTTPSHVRHFLQWVPKGLQHRLFDLLFPCPALMSWEFVAAKRHRPENTAALTAVLSTLLRPPQNFALDPAPAPLAVSTCRLCEFCQPLVGRDRQHGPTPLPAWARRLFRHRIGASSA